MLTALAPAKVNLFLHVGPLDGDGYHPLSSLIAFADVGDRVTVRPGLFGMDVSGPFSEGVPADGDNLVLRALVALGEATGIGLPELRVSLDKRLPVASGLGGGSSDAGAALRLAREALDMDINDEALAGIALTTGSDGPMCLFPQPAWAEGRGERLMPEPRLPALPCVLLNPGVPSPTGAVYRAYDDGPVRSSASPAAPDDWSVPGVINWLRHQRNDLEAPAMSVTPGIGEGLEAMSRTPGVRLIRMSGSGATVFGLFETMADAKAAENLLKHDHGDWWVTATLLGDALANFRE